MLWFWNERLAQVWSSSLFCCCSEVNGMECERGWGRLFPSLIRDLVSRHKLDMLFLFETRVSGARADRIISRMGFSNSCKIDAIGYSGGIWLLWNGDCVDVDILLTHRQFIHVKVKSSPREAPWFLTGVYGSPQIQGRNELWCELKHLAPSCTGPWLVWGDFNSFSLVRRMVGEVDRIFTPCKGSITACWIVDLLM